MSNKKEYDTVMVTQKNGRIVPITKLTKPCPVCGLKMYIKRHKEGGVHKRSKMWWACSEKFCNHEELEEGSMDTYIRMGVLDDDIGILPLANSEEDI